MSFITSTGSEFNEIIFSLWWDYFWEVWDRRREIEIIKPSIDELAKSGGTLLDIGCADMLLYQRGCFPLPDNYIGIEPCSFLYKLAKMRYPTHNIYFQSGDEFEIASNSVDITLCLWVLHYNVNIAKVLNKCITSTKPGGKLFISLPDEESQLYENIFSLASDLFPSLHLTNPNVKIQNIISSVRESLAHTVVKETHTSCQIQLPDNPLRRIIPIFTFIDACMPIDTSREEMFVNLFSSIDKFDTFPKKIEDKVLVIESRV